MKKLLSIFLALALAATFLSVGASAFRVVGLADQFDSGFTFYFDQAGEDIADYPEFADYLDDIGFNDLLAGVEDYLAQLIAAYYEKFLERYDFLTPEQVEDFDAGWDVDIDDFFSYLVGGDGQTYLDWLAQAIVTAFLAGQDFDELPSFEDTVASDDFFMVLLDAINQIAMEIAWEAGPLDVGWLEPADLEGFEYVPTVYFTLTFDANGGTGTMAPAVYEAGATVTLPACTFTAPAGQRFRFWGDAGDAAAGITAVTMDDSKTVYAIWEDIDTPPTTYTFTYNFNYDGAPPPVAAVVVAGATIDVGKSLPGRAGGWLFKGWYEDAACSQGKYVNAQAVTVNADTVVYAKWVKINQFQFFFVRLMSEGLRTTALGNYLTRTLGWVLEYLLFGWLWGPALAGWAAGVPLNWYK